MLVCLILAGALAIAVQRLSTTRGPVDAAGEDSPWTGALWSDLIQDNRTTALVLADPTLVLAQNAMRSSISLQEYTARGLRPRIESGIADPELRDMVRTVISWQVASLADVDLLRRILIMRPITPRQFTVYMARDFNLRLLATGNTILVGGRRSNPWVESFYDSLTFHVEHDESTQLPYILNRSPRPNEQKEYRQDALVGSPRTYGYASVAYIRSPGSSGSVLLLSGTDGQASESAVRFVTTERLFMAFCRTIASTPRRRLPYFEVLLRNEKVSSSPMNVTPIAWRVH
jgi:hypothetical protein